MLAPFFNDDRQQMALAIELARQGEGAVEPNPMVGAVVVQQGKIVGRGAHQKHGGPHAEIYALDEAGDRARGATIYITLEPCCHTGKTPPCTEALIAAGIARVVVAVGDPFPQVDGGGFEQLRQAGITCESGLLEAEATELLAPYLHLTTTGRPWVIAKWAMTLDGKIATHTQSSQWISSPASREIVHRLRGRVDAILVGAGTARADDPRLTARPPGPRNALRIVLGEISPTSQLAATASDLPLLSVVASAEAAERQAWLRSVGGEVLFLTAATQAEQIDQLLLELGRRRVTNLLVEGGAKVLGAFFDLGAVNEVHAFIAPKIAGGADAPSPVAGRGIAQMEQALQLSSVKVTEVGGDVYLQGRLPPQ